MGFVFFLLTLPAIVMLLHIISKYPSKKGQYLNISRGSESFVYGNDKTGISTYRKKEVTSVKHYSNNNSQSLNSFHLYEIIFKDNSFLTFSNALISPDDFDIKWRIPVEKCKKAPIKLSWLA